MKNLLLILFVLCGFSLVAQTKSKIIDKNSTDVGSVQFVEINPVNVVSAELVIPLSTKSVTVSGVEPQQSVNYVELSPVSVVPMNDSITGSTKSIVVNNISGKLKQNPKVVIVPAVTVLKYDKIITKKTKKEKQ